MHEIARYYPVGYRIKDCFIIMFFEGKCKDIIYFKYKKRRVT